MADDAIANTTGRQRWGWRLRQEYLEPFQLCCSKRKVLSVVKLKLTALPVCVGRDELRGETWRVQKSQAAAAIVERSFVTVWLLWEVVAT